jgi:hypothetical protein
MSGLFFLPHMVYIGLNPQAMRTEISGTRLKRPCHHAANPGIGPGGRVFRGIIFLLSLRKQQR